MNYTIVAHRETDSGTDRRGDYYRNPGDFYFRAFQEDQKGEFISKWAEFSLENNHDDLHVMINGLTEDEFAGSTDPLDVAKYSEFAAITELMYLKRAVLHHERAAKEAGRLGRETAQKAVNEIKNKLVARQQAEAEIIRLQNSLRNL